MAESLSPECTSLKIAYDSCFNAWFEGYLEPAVAAASASPQQRQVYSQQKAAEFQEKCGGIWEDYRKCVQVALCPFSLSRLSLTYKNGRKQ